VGQLRRELTYLALASGIVFLLMVVSTWILTRQFVRSPNAPWHERARLFWPAKTILATGILFFPLGFAVGPAFKQTRVETLIHPVLSG
jgi:hypothetical protein